MKNTIYIIVTCVPDGETWKAFATASQRGGVYAQADAVVGRPRPDLKARPEMAATRAVEEALWALNRKTREKKAKE